MRWILALFWFGVMLKTAFEADSKDASNLVEWASLFGMDNFHAVLLNPSADTVGVVVAGILLIPLFVRYKS